MADVVKLAWWTIIDLLRSRASLEVEIVAQHQQLNLLRRKSARRLAFSTIDRLILAGPYQIASRIIDALAIVTPETVIHSHRAGFGLLWRWKSRPRGGRPEVAQERARTSRGSGCKAHCSHTNPRADETPEAIARVIARGGSPPQR
ncbi:hypothetical protein LG047_05265 [Methylocystis sp. WRRC1]|uniref:hypothetical protein n=1 Tax=Methylocystis sp. WRRC1 TaxID=1732014 RepID=UPI001D1577C6|nr:hypothetical protein [Methylocystis sp. WRRC1]MCC3244734.1 hypothetical protein [Methylocystis sp. WRRC1]